MNISLTLHTSGERGFDHLVTTCKTIDPVTAATFLGPENCGEIIMDLTYDQFIKLMKTIPHSVESAEFTIHLNPLP